MSKFQVKKYLSPKRQSERHALLAIAKALVRASTESAAAGDDILYHLPGVFSLRITYKGEAEKQMLISDIKTCYEKVKELGLDFTEGNLYTEKPFDLFNI